MFRLESKPRRVRIKIYLRVLAFFVYCAIFQGVLYFVACVLIATVAAQFQSKCVMCRCESLEGLPVVIVPSAKTVKFYREHFKAYYTGPNINTFTAIVDLSRFNNSCLKSRQRRP